jgi:translocator protein
MQAWQWVVPLTTLFTLTMNVLANLLPMAGRTTAEISDSFPALFTPAGYVFSIWGVIYILLLGFSLYQALPANADHPRLRAIAQPIALGSVANGIWIALWHHLWIGASVFATLVLLLTLALAHQRLRAPLTRRGPPVTRAERFWARGMVSVYLGWASVATVANITVYLYQRGHSVSFLALPAQFWGVVVLAVATGLGAVMLRRHRDFAYAAVLVWAFVGIVVAQSAAHFVAAAALVGGVGLALLALQAAQRAPGRP